MNHDDDLRGSGRPTLPPEQRGHRDPLGDGDSHAADRRQAAMEHPQDDGAEPAVVVLGRVGTWDEANAIKAALAADGFGATDVEVFFTGPAGRHAQTPIGGDAYADAGATEAGKGAAVGGGVGAAAGLAVGAALATAPVAGPLLLTGAAVGAFGGALAGGVAATRDGAKQPDTEEHPVAKPGGVVVAARVDGLDDGDAIAVRRLREAGALAIERTAARWRDGTWIDFDPSGPREEIDPSPGVPQAGDGRSQTPFS